MSFVDTTTVAELSLREEISIEADNGDWITGTVVELSLLGDDEQETQVILRTSDGTYVSFNRTPDTSVIYAFATL